MSSFPDNLDGSISDFRSGTSANSVSLSAGGQSSFDTSFGSRVLGSTIGSTGSGIFKEHRSSARGTTSSSASRAILPYVTHYSDSGFSSTLSSGSSCSHLPPPPPYRMRTSGKAHRIHRSLSDSKYGATTGCQPLGDTVSAHAGGSMHVLQELCCAQRAGSWTSRVSYLFLCLSSSANLLVSE
ncbi:unnamed protein product [Toxocara canis]|uniref:E3 ubiquitin-protein ligase UNKL n=1 Tax=Toxocara canis TaxID=6265 RepID=A0A183UMX0_TOXCA|nr:unnamed protein product [Toxocara canis]